MPASDSTPPMMRQYRRIKSEHQDAIVFFRLGDFYEMFFEDAEEASDLLDITLTARHKGKEHEAPMCGVPAHSAEGYIAKLLEAGRKVAVAEQVGDPSESRGPVDREVVRVITPGTLVEDSLLPGGDSNYLVAVTEDDVAVGLAVLEISTGEFVAAEFDGEERYERARDEVERFAPREVCHREGADPDGWLGAGDTMAGAARRWTWSAVTPWKFDPDRAERRLCDHLGVTSLAGYDLEGQRAAIGAAGALLAYAVDTQKAPLQHIRAIRRYREREILQLDATTRRTLELVESWQERTREGSLLEVVDETATSMGGRLLRQWLLRPLRDPAVIVRRQELVELLHDATVGRDELRGLLRQVRDLERLTTRVTLGSANPRDIWALRTSLEVLPDVRAKLAWLIGEGPSEEERDSGSAGDADVVEPTGGAEPVEGSGQAAAAEVRLGAEILERMDPCEDVAAAIAVCLVDDPPAAVGDGGVVRDGFDDELDRFREARGEGKEFIAELQARERESTGIGSLKVGFNKVFGYYIEVSKANLGKVPDSYTRKQTLSNSERYITPELKEFEETVLNAEERIEELELELFAALRDEVAEEASRLHETARAVGETDVLVSLAEVAAQRGYVRPEVDAGNVIEIRKGRHPVVEVLAAETGFVPNDTYLDDGDHRLQILTGPNMGGKSTYLRQVALIVILAQMGGFVPAESARIGVVDRIFTRVGASDNLARGASTFLVEMQETANILHNATAESLVILDEVGRGTSTYDGLALAWAVVEFLEGPGRERRTHGADPGREGRGGRGDGGHREGRAGSGGGGRSESRDRGAPRTLFATHYHELTSLEGMLPGVRNLNVAAHEGPDGVVFLHQVEPDPADRSYGIHVGRLAGLPAEVVDRAEEILANLEASDAVDDEAGPRWAPRADADGGQMALFEPEAHPVVRRLRETDVDGLTPLEALNLLAAWKAELEEDGD